MTFKFEEMNHIWDFETWVHSQVRSVYAKNTCHFEMSRGRLPCYVCGGQGWDWEEGSRPDVYEGNKLRLKVTCKSCNGEEFVSKEISKGAWEYEYSLYKNELKRQNRIKEHKNKVAKKALKKLTKVEKKVLGLI